MLALMRYEIHCEVTFINGFVGVGEFLFKPLKALDTVRKYVIIFTGL